MRTQSVGSSALADQTRKIITIEASDRQSTKRLKVAAYARVSTNSEDQMNSFSAQTEYYSALIEENKAWSLVDMYADATDIIGLKQNPTNGRRFSPTFFVYRAFST